MNGRKGKSRLRGPKCKLRSRLKTKERASILRTNVRTCFVQARIEGESVYFIWREMRGRGEEARKRFELEESKEGRNRN